MSAKVFQQNYTNQSKVYRNYPVDIKSFEIHVNRSAKGLKKDPDLISGLDTEFSSHC